MNANLKTTHIGSSTAVDGAPWKLFALWGSWSLLNRFALLAGAFSILFQGAPLHSQSEASAQTRTVSPAVYNLHVEPFLKESYAARLTWQVDKKNRSPLVVGRSSQPIIDAEAVQKADNLTVNFLHPEATEYIDRNIDEGIHYYTVLSIDEIRSIHTSSLSPGGNYTLNPFLVSRDRRPDDQKTKTANTDRSSTSEKPENENAGNLNTTDETPEGKLADRKKETEDRNGKLKEKPIIEALVVRYVKPHAVLSWAPVQTENASSIVYNVYRSEREIKTEEDLLEATVIGRVRGDRNTFRDRNPLNRKLVYYGVVQKQSSLEEELAGFQKGASLVIFQRPDDKPAKEIADSEKSETKAKEERNWTRPDYLLAAPENGKVKLMFDFPPNTEETYSVYRNTSAITGVDSLEQSIRVGTIHSSDHQFVDQSIPGKQESENTGYFYALVPAGFPLSSSKESPDRDAALYFIAGRSTTDRAIAYMSIFPQSEEKPNSEKPIGTPQNYLEPSVTDLNIQEKDQSSVRLTWNLRGPAGDYHRFLVYRSRVPLQDLDRIRKAGKLIADLEPGAWGFTDEHPGQGENYYAVLLERSGTVDLVFQEGENILLHPVIIRKPINRNIAPRRTGALLTGQEAADDPALDEILARTFFHGDYRSAKRLLVAIENNPGISEQTRARARFFRSLALIHMGSLESGSRLLRSRLVRKHHPLEWKRWHKRISLNPSQER